MSSKSRLQTRLVVGAACAPSSSPKQRALSNKRDYTFWESAPDGSMHELHLPDSDDKSPTSGDRPILTSINEWPSSFNAGELKWSQELADAAASTGQQNNGGLGGLRHHNPEGVTELFAPGSNWEAGMDLETKVALTPFEVSLMWWLCEDSTFAKGDVCDKQNSILNLKATYHGTSGFRGIRTDLISSPHSTTEGHNALADNYYTQIGCAFTKNPDVDNWFSHQGQWVCEIATSDRQTPTMLESS